MRNTTVSTCSSVAHAGKSRTHDHSSSTPEVAGPGADHPPPAANPRCSQAADRPCSPTGVL
ncbi:hypothetical protein CVV67_09950 [Arthrobacter stackebrandtii]|nr:hypothetical protein CVV67_09950 [Arthrobacter stackebrandtii]